MEGASAMYMESAWSQSMRPISDVSLVGGVLARSDPVVSGLSGPRRIRM